MGGVFGEIFFPSIQARSKEGIKVKVVHAVLSHCAVPARGISCGLIPYRASVFKSFTMLNNLKQGLACPKHSLL